FIFDVFFGHSVLRFHRRSSLGLSDSSIDILQQLGVRTLINIFIDGFLNCFYLQTASSDRFLIACISKTRPISSKSIFRGKYGFRITRRLKTKIEIT
ncbi:MAG: hypothetical protein ACRC00_11210, partial [Exiguobacterium acetylicum]